MLLSISAGVVDGMGAAIGQVLYWVALAMLKLMHPFEPTIH
jgi:hypothetical protein